MALAGSAQAAAKELEQGSEKVQVKALVKEKEAPCAMEHEKAQEWAELQQC